MRLAPFAALLLLGCSPAPVARPPESAEPVDVNWRTMVRDRQTASAYAGHRVRFRLMAADCVFEGRTVRVWYGAREGVPATLIIHATEPVVGSSPYVVTGLCGEAVVDGVRRGAHIDYYVTVTDARVVSTKPAP